MVNESVNEWNEIAIILILLLMLLLLSGPIFLKNSNQRCIVVISKNNNLQSTISQFSNFILGIEVSEEGFEPSVLDCLPKERKNIDVVRSLAMVTNKNSTNLFFHRKSYSFHFTFFFFQTSFVYHLECKNQLHKSNQYSLEQYLRTNIEIDAMRMHYYFMIKNQRPMISHTQLIPRLLLKRKKSRRP